VPIQEACKIYGQLTHRTILRPTNLPRLSDSLVTRMEADTNAAPALLEAELAERDISVVRDGESFVRFLPKGWQASPLAAQLGLIESRAKEGASEPSFLSPAPALGAGCLDFRGADVSLVLDIYSELANRTVLRPWHVAGYALSIRTETSLSRRDAIYALNVLLTLNGFAVVEDGSKFVQVVPIPQFASVKPNAPATEPGEPLISPADIPVFRTDLYPPRDIPSTADRERTGSRLPPSRPRQPGVDDLVAYYAGITGQKAQASKFAERPVFLRSKTPLTRSELRYAIETTLALDGLTIVHGDEGVIRAGELPVAPTPERNRAADRGTN
jgi:hypothetical protein